MIYHEKERTNSNAVLRAVILHIIIQVLPNDIQPFLLLWVDVVVVSLRHIVFKSWQEMLKYGRDCGIMNKKTARRYSIMKDNHLQAVHDDDLSSLLSSLGVYEKVHSGQCVCSFCQKTITLENLGALIPLDGEIVFSCDSHICLNSMMEAGEIK